MRKVSKNFINLQEEFPNIAKEWHPTKNGKLTPLDVSQGQAIKVWWRCKCGNEWYQSLNGRDLRSKKTRGCPVCGKKKSSILRKKNALKKSGTFRNKFPDLFNELHPIKNNHIDFEKVTPHSQIRVWWICKKSHIWDSRLNNRTSNNRGCPKCKQNTSKIELRFYCELKKIFKDTLWQHKLNKKEIDIFIPSLKFCIEIDGYPWHENKFSSDKNKNLHVSKLGYNLLRIRESRLSKHFGKNEIVDYFENSLDIFINTLKYILNSIKIQKSKISIINRIIKEHKFQSDKEYNLLLSKLPGPIKDEDRFDKNFPELLKEWNFVKNNPLTPNLFFKFSHDKIWWICKNKHVWRSSIANRTNLKRDCKKCAIKSSGNRRRKAAIDKYGTFFNKNKLLYDEWDFIKNESVDINLKSAWSNDVVWWICINCKYNWKTSIAHRTRGRGCIKCGRKIVGLKNKIRYSKDLTEIQKEKIILKILKLSKAEYIQN